MQDGFKKVLTEKISLFMTLFNISFDQVYSMPVEKLNAVLNWRIKYEEAKRKSVEDEMSKHKETMKSKNNNKIKNIIKCFLKQ